MGFLGFREVEVTDLGVLEGGEIGMTSNKGEIEETILGLDFWRSCLSKKNRWFFW